MIASYGTLLDWLNRYTFPAELAFAERAHADAAAEFFLDRLLENGTTTAAVFCTVHPQSVDAFFTASEARGVGMIAGKCLMDRHAPDGLTDTADTGYRDSKALIEAVARPRPLALRHHAALRTHVHAAADAGDGAAGARAPGVYIQSHVAENRAEIAWVNALFPGHRSYLDVYDHYGLLRDRAIYAHCIHLDDADRARMTAAGPAIVLPNVEPVHRQRPLQPAAGARGGQCGERGHRYRRRHQLLNAAHAGRGVQVQQLLGTSLSPAYAL